MNHLEIENRDFFKAWDPALLTELVESDQVQVLAARREGLTLRVGTLFVHGKYNPGRDAEILIEQQTVGPQGLHLHFGFGLGWLLQADETLANGQILIFEPNPAIAAAALAHIPLAALFRQKNARLFCSLARLRDWLRGHLKWEAGLRILVNPYHQANHPADYQAFCETVKNERNRAMLMQARGVKKIFRIFLESTLRSLPFTTQLPGVNRLLGAFKGMPAVIVAAGPSLDKNLLELGAVADKTLIFAISRAVRPLDAWGIRPHFLVQTEAKNYLYLIEQCANLRQTTLLLADQCHEGYFQYPSPFKFCFQNPGNIVTSWMLSHFPQLKRQFLATAGSVATDAFSLAMVMGCNPIILIGQDLALTKARYYAEASTNIAFRHKESELASTSGYFGGMVPTVANYLYFESWYEEAVKHYHEQFPDRVFINATEGGAHLEGFQHLKFSHVARQYLTQKLDPHPILEQAARIPADQTLPAPELEAFLGQTQQKLEVVLDQCRLFRSFESQFGRDLAALDGNNMLRVQEQLARMDQFQSDFYQHLNDLRLLPGFCDEDFQPGAELAEYPDLDSLGRALREDLKRASFNLNQLEIAGNRLAEILAHRQPGQT